MTTSTLICNYIYQTFLIIKATIETFLPLIKNMISKLTTMVTMFKNLLLQGFLDTIDSATKSLANIEKYLCDFLNNKIGKSTWCESLFLCEAFVDELLTEGRFNL